MQDLRPEDSSQMIDEYSFCLSHFHRLLDSGDTTQARSQFWICRL